MLPIALNIIASVLVLILTLVNVAAWRRHRVAERERTAQAGADLAQLTELSADLVTLKAERDAAQHQNKAAAFVVTGLQLKLMELEAERTPPRDNDAFMTRAAFVLARRTLDLLVAQAGLKVAS